MKIISAPPLWILAPLAALLVIGCTPLHMSRTVSVSGLPVVADPNKMTVIDYPETVTRPHQIIGKVTVYRSGTRIMKGGTTERICENAAQMGADGVIDLHPNFGKGLYSGLAVKWLAPGEKAKPKEFPFMVALLPIVLGANTPPNKVEIGNFLQERLVYLMDTKGYYLMPEVVAGFDGGIAAAMKLDDAALQALGGKDTDLLLEVAIVDANSKIEWGLFGAAKDAKAVVRTTLMNKTTRKIVFQNMASGYFSIGSLEMFSDVTAIGNATFQGAEESLNDLKDIHDASSF